MKIAIGCDHGALDLKNTVIAHLEKQGHEVRVLTLSPDGHAHFNDVIVIMVII